LTRKYIKKDKGKLATKTSYADNKPRPINNATNKSKEPVDFHTIPKLNSKEYHRRLRIIKRAEVDLEYFISIVAPYRALGHVHQELCQWWERSNASSHQMALLPRDHGKSAMTGYRVAQRIARQPDVRILYISSTANLAEKQLKAVKDILTSDAFMYYWPKHILPDEGKREKWTTGEICIDHPLRKEEGIRDPTVFTGGLTTSLTGLHCDVAVLDDVVVRENAYTTDGRRKVQEQYSLLSSIEGAEAEEWVVGTRYHPRDLYQDLIEMSVEQYDEEGDVVGSDPLYEVFERQVEDRGDGTGQFLWPRQQRMDGKWFGFNTPILAKKRAQYLDKMQYRAQYYNNPNDSSESPLQPDMFQYYDKNLLSQNNGHWYFKDRRLNVFAAIDFAFSTKSTADSTSLCVIGMDCDRNIYVLDIDRFKTDKISVYYSHILSMHIKWGFRKLRAEVNVAQVVIVKELKNEYIKPHGLSLSIDEHRPTRSQGSKEERMAAVLEPRYANQSIWHFRGGNCELLEEELILQKPPHDDIKDALAAVIDIAVPPSGHQRRGLKPKNNVIRTSRFGGYT